MRPYLAILGASALVWFGCPSNLQPCVNCPAVQGRYDLVTEEPNNRRCLDGGTVAGGDLSLAQLDSNLSGTFANLELRGVLYEANQLSLGSRAGFPGSDAGIPPPDVASLTLFGRFVPGTVSAPDRIIGDLTVNYEPDGGTACTVGARFTATKR